MTSAEIIKRLREESDDRAMKHGAPSATVERYRAAFYEIMMDDLIDTLLAIAEGPTTGAWAQDNARRAIRQITFPPETPAGPATTEAGPVASK